MRDEGDGPAGRRAGAGRRMPIVRSVERATRIVQALVGAPEGRCLVELSEELGLHKTTVLRLLHTLLSMRVIDRHPADDRYYWNPVTWLPIAARAGEMMSRAASVLPVLEQLAEATGETAAIGLPDLAEREMRMVVCALPNKPVRVDPRVRPSLPIHSVAAGKCYLASLPAAELDKWTKAGLPATTEHTITSRKRLREELAQARRRGYAVSREEGLSGACAVAIAVVNPRGRPIGAVGITAPRERFSDADIRRWLPRLRAAAEEIAGLLGTFADANAEQELGGRKKGR